MSSPGKEFEKLCRVIARLRDPKKGCPWDRKQTHKSLRKFMIEEAYEAAAVMGTSPTPELCDELGDVLLQVVLNAQVAKENGSFDVRDVVRAITDKMQRRHPHVFSKNKNTRSARIKELRTQWNAIKIKEKLNRLQAKTLSHNFNKSLKTSISEELALLRGLPSLLEAEKIGSIMRKVDFDWKKARNVFKQVQEECNEVRRELKFGSRKGRQAEEIGDLLFSIVQLCRHLQIDPEIALKDANAKFVKRFKAMEQKCEKENISFATLSLRKKEILWKWVKEGSRKSTRRPDRLSNTGILDKKSIPNEG